MGEEALQSVEFVVNGRPVTIEGAGGVPLLHVLREDLNLKATRFGCGQGTCGACTVIVDGQPVLSCDTPVEEIAGKRIETAESLAGETDHPLLAAFLNRQAGQCGYCLPGILMAAKALLDAEPSPSRARIAEALDANLCRCGAHTRILDAVEDAARRMSEAR